jgi:hypothetical protein
MRTIQAPEFMMVLNIPYEVRLSREGVREHVRIAAANQQYVMVKKTCGDTEASMRPVEGLSAGESFGVIVECRKTKQFEGKAIPTHFAVTTNMENEGGMRVYCCQILTNDQVHTLTSKTRALVAVIRGCAKFDTIDDMMLRAVNHFLIKKKVIGCTTTVEQLFHRIDNKGVREAMMAVYAPSNENLTVLRKSLGFDRGRTEVRAEIRGLVFQAVPDARQMKGKSIPYWGDKVKLHATLNNVDTEVPDQAINDAVIAAFGLCNVDYWVTKQTIRGTSVIVGLTQGFETSRADLDALRTILREADDRLMLDFDRPLPRRDDGQYAKVLQAPQGRMSSATSWSSGSRSSGRTSGSDGGRGRQGRTNGS